MPKGLCPSCEGPFSVNGRGFCENKKCEVIFAGDAEILKNNDYIDLIEDDKCPNCLGELDKKVFLGYCKDVLAGDGSYTQEEATPHRRCLKCRCTMIIVKRKQPKQPTLEERVAILEKIVGDWGNFKDFQDHIAELCKDSQFAQPEK